MSERCNFYFGGIDGGNRCQGTKGHPEAEGHHWQADREIVIEGVPAQPPLSSRLTEWEIKGILYDALKNQFPSEGTAIMIAKCCAEPIWRALESRAIAL